MQGRLTEEGREMVLPGLDLQGEIGHRCGAGHGMAPEGAEPLHMRLQAGVAGELVQRIEDVAPAHLLEAPQQGAGVIEHDPRIAALCNQLRDQIRHAAVALGKGFSVVVIAFAWVLQHVLEMADQLTMGPGGDGGLMHVERAGKAGVHPRQAFRWAGRRCLRHQGAQFSFTASHWGERF